MHKKIIFIASVLVLMFAGTAFGVAMFNHNNSMGMDASKKTETAKRQSSARKIESKEKTEDVKKVIEEESKEELKEEQNIQTDEEKPEEPKQEEPKKDEPKPDVITIEDVEDTEAIAFETTTKNEVNLKRGQIKVDREGVEGLRRIVTRMTYKNDELISSEEIYNEIEKEPVNQINLIGVSDFNLNEAYVQLYPNASVVRDGNTAPASMILVNDKFYMDFWRDPVTWSRIAPSKAVLVSGGSFNYGGITYEYRVGSVDEGYPLTSGFCNEYGLACGRW